MAEVCLSEFSHLSRFKWSIRAIHPAGEGVEEHQRRPETVTERGARREREAKRDVCGLSGSTHQSKAEGGPGDQL